MIKYYNIEKFDKTGLVKTLLVPKADVRWRVYSYNEEDNLHDLIYYEDIGKSFGIKPSDMIRTLQDHTDNILQIEKEDAGLGVVRREPEIPYDGLITNVKNIMLLNIESDCTPVFILDPVNLAIGIVHSGWRGTVKKVTCKTIDTMHEKYGTDKKDVLIYFGPAICKNCYEVGIELIDEFKKILACVDIHKIFTPIIDKPEKYGLDVTEAIRLTLLEYGVKNENIERSEFCTCHDNIFNSWRRDRDKTKQMLTGIMLI